MHEWIRGVIARVRRRLRLRRQRAMRVDPLPDVRDMLPSVDLRLPRTLPSGRDWPRITVVTPSFNQGRFIEETIQSIASQNYPSVEHIVIDGGSTDTTLSVLERYRSHITHLVSEPDRGQSDALNKGFRLASGDILCWLNSDDAFSPGALAAVAMAFDTHDVDMVSGICEIFEDDRLVHRHMSACSDGLLPILDLLDLDTGWNAGQFFYQPEVFFSRSMWERAGGYVRDDLFYSMDYELWCRFAVNGARLHVVGAPLARFRRHADQKTAQPEKFKRELIQVRDDFSSRRSLAVAASSRPAADPGRSLTIAMVNDVGVRYGAGIAHGRIAAALDMAGHHVELLDLSSHVAPDGVLDDALLASRVSAVEPDAVLFGNCHSVTRDSVQSLEMLGAQFPVFWVTHDFWLITGRCAYTGDCRDYLAGCHESCPSANSYPELAPDKISPAWKRKRALLDGASAPFILANSQWSAERFREATDRAEAVRQDTVRTFKLGAPVRLFRPLDKARSRAALGIKPHSFVIAFSVSSLGEGRKGGHHLVQALREMERSDVTVLLLGHLDVPFDIDDVDVVPLGYVTDAATMIAALSAADVYVGPSTEETFGQVFVEAALVGIPSIGFDLTGVRDSIIQGVTGLRVAPNSDALRGAIEELRGDRELCLNLGACAAVYARNEFSLEASYHSLFCAWDSLGLIDRWKLPHKIGFIRATSLVDQALGQVSRWRSTYGVSHTEGPYPQYSLPTTFKWCHGPQSRLLLCFAEAGPHEIVLSYYSTLFTSLNLKVSLNDHPLGPFKILETPNGASRTLSFVANVQLGTNILDLFPSAAHTPSTTEPRALTFMLRDITWTKLDSVNG